MGGNSEHATVQIQRACDGVGGEEQLVADDGKGTSGTAGIAIFRRPQALGHALVHSLHAFTLVLLTLVLPLSLLLVARLSSAPHLLAFPRAASPLSRLFSAFRFAVLLVPHVLVPLLCLSTLPALRPNLRLSWAVVIISHSAVTLGLDVTIAAGVHVVAPAQQLETGTAGWVKGAVFFLGVYETTMFWSKAFARQVVDDAIFGTSTTAADPEGTAAKRAVVGVVLGVLWLAMLRREVVEGLAGSMAAEGWHGWVCWSIGRLVIVVGAIRIANGIGCAVDKYFLHQRVEEASPDASDLEV